MTPNNLAETELEAEAAAIVSEAESIVEGAALLAVLPKNATFADLIAYIKADQKRIALVAASLSSD